MNFDKVTQGPLNPPVSPNSMHPPTSLLQFIPLALFCNALLGAFNALRLNAPLALAAPITTLVEKSMLLASKAILARYRQEELAFSSVEQQGVQRLCTCFADDFVPHVQKCLQSLFPVAGLAAHLGLSPQQIQKDKIGFLNKVEIIDPIRHLLPVKIEPMSLISAEKPKENPSPEVEVENKENEDTPVKIVPAAEDIVSLIETETPQSKKFEAPVEESNVSLLTAASTDVISDVPLVPVKESDASEDLMATSSESFDMCNSKVEESSTSTTNGMVESIETIENQSDVDSQQ